MYFNMDSMYEQAKMLHDYVSKSHGYNLFIIDNVDDNLVRALGAALQKENKKEAVRFYMKLDKQIDKIRDEYCYNVLPYKSSFRQIAKELYLEIKDSWLYYQDDFDYIMYILKFISTSDYYIIREFLIKRSSTMFWYWDIPLDPETFYCKYIPLEALLDYCLKLTQSYMKKGY